VRIIKKHVDEMLGFPVAFDEVFAIEIYGNLVPLIDYDALELKALEFLADKPGRLTGPEIRFIRKYFNMTLARFGGQFGVTHSAVKKWEDGTSVMNWGTEALLRLLAYRASGKRSIESLLESLVAPRAGAEAAIQVRNAEINRNVTRLLDPDRDKLAIAYVKKRMALHSLLPRDQRPVPKKKQRKSL